MCPLITLQPPRADGVHNLTVRSRDADAMSKPSCENSACWTEAVCPLNRIALKGAHVQGMQVDSCSRGTREVEKKEAYVHKLIASRRTGMTAVRTHC